jgi:hypothetical protein
MKTLRWFMVLALVLSVAGLACDSSSSTPGDVGVATDNGSDVAPPTDTTVDQGKTDEGLTDIPGLTDNGKDQGTHDVTSVDAVISDVQVGCQVVVTGPACRQMAACALQCNESGHEAKCVGATTGDEKARFEVVRDCLATAACPVIFENEQFTECATTACGNEIDACFQTTNGKCCQVVKCRKKCDAGDPSCPMSCFGMATTTEQDKFIAYKDCLFGVECASTNLLDNGWPTQSCEDNAQGNYCPTFTQDCFPLVGCT